MTFNSIVESKGFEAASSLGVRQLAHNALIAGQVLFVPSFHPAVSVAFEYVDRGTLDVRAVADHSLRLVLLERLALSDDASAGLVDALNAVQSTRMESGGAVLDGMFGAVWLLRGGETQRWGGHFSLVGPSDPMTLISSMLLGAALASVQSRDAMRALEQASTYLAGFTAIRTSGGQPWSVRLVQHLTSRDLADLERVLNAIGPSEEVTVDLRDCESVAGLAWPVLGSFDRTHPRVQWLAVEPLASLLALHVSPTRIRS